MYKKIVFTAWLCVAVLFSGLLSAKNAVPKSLPFVLNNTFMHQVKSKSNGVSYRLYISLPKHYASTKKHYPVIYLLDADYSFALAKQITDHLSARHKLKETIIVGIAYADSEKYKANRTRDYTPSFVENGGYGPKYQKDSGGAEKFYQFIESELLPLIQRHYRVEKNATLIGHSFGGLFGMYVFLHHLETFQNYILVSPSLWYDDHLLLRTAQNKDKLDSNQLTNLFMFVGDEENNGDYQMINDVIKFEEILNQSSHKNLSATIQIIPNAEHDTVFPTALSRGLLALD